MNLNGTGLGLAAGQFIKDEYEPREIMDCSRPTIKVPVMCSDEDWGWLEGALRGLSVLEAIDVSDNEKLGTSGVGRLVSCCAGEAFACVT